MDSYEIRVDGVPAGQERPRSRKGMVGVYVPKSGRSWAWRQQIILTAQAYTWWSAMPLRGPLRVCCLFFLPRPKYMQGPNWPGTPLPYDKVPDRDNLDKVVLDALSNAGMWEDDKQACQGPPEKWYCAAGQRPGVIVHVTAASTWCQRYALWAPWKEGAAT